MTVIVFSFQTGANVVLLPGRTTNTTVSKAGSVVVGPGIAPRPSGAPAMKSIGNKPTVHTVVSSRMSKLAYYLLTLSL